MLFLVCSGRRAEDDVHLSECPLRCPSTFPICDVSIIKVHANQSPQTSPAHGFEELGAPVEAGSGPRGGRRGVNCKPGMLGLPIPIAKSTLHYTPSSLIR